jgi:hypothetical protein
MRCKEPGGNCAMTYLGYIIPQLGCLASPGYLACSRRIYQGET